MEDRTRWPDESIGKNECEKARVEVDLLIQIVVMYLYKRNREKERRRLNELYGVKSA